MMEHDHDHEHDLAASERERADGTETAPVAPAFDEDEHDDSTGAGYGGEPADDVSGESAERRDEVRNQVREDAAQEAEDRAERIRAEQPRDTRAERAESDEEASDDELLVGTGTERAPGTGGGGEHPAPAVMRDPNTGYLRQHGEALNTAGDQAPLGDDADATVAEDSEGEPQGVVEPEQVDTDRIDIGTPVEGDAGTAPNDQEDDA
jgi:hypothetical protein